MENKSKIKVLIIVIFIYILIVFLALFFYNNRNAKNYMVLSTDKVYELNKGKIKEVSISSMDELNKMTFFMDGKKIGEFPISISNTIKVDGENLEITEFSNSTIIGIPRKYKLPVYEYQSEYLDSSDEVNIQKFLQSKGIVGYESLSISNKINYDFNQDGIEETLYIISNAFVEETYDKVFSYIYYQDGNETQVLLEKIVSVSDWLKSCHPFLNNIVDFNQDNNMDLIIGCRYFDQLGSEYDFLEIKNNEYHSILD